jgi:hypothetical protein
MFKSLLSFALLAGATAQAAELTALESAGCRRPPRPRLFPKPETADRHHRPAPGTSHRRAPGDGLRQGPLQAGAVAARQSAGRNRAGGRAGERQGELIEAMAAHEIAHCWRHAQGAWNALPAGFVQKSARKRRTTRAAGGAKALRESRREEAYADLAALAWTRHSNPDAYGRVHGWLARCAARADGRARRPRYPGLGRAGTRRQPHQADRVAVRRRPTPCSRTRPAPYVARRPVDTGTNTRSAASTAAQPSQTRVNHLWFFRQVYVVAQMSCGVGRLMTLYHNNRHKGHRP